MFRDSRGKDLPGWPDWCFMPMAAWYSIACHINGVDRLLLDLATEPARLGALGTWRYTQSVYRLDPDLFKAVWNTVPTGDLPCEVIYRMPEWCV